jgi:hypothetical protein
MSTVLSALVVVGALAASGALLVQLAISESRHGRQRAELPVRAPPREHGTPLVPVMPPPAQVRPVVWAPRLSPDGAWLWTGSDWVPSWWGGPTVPPPPPQALAPPPRPVRSHGCAAACAVGCAVVFGLVALGALAVLAAAARLASLVGG